MPRQGLPRADILVRLLLLALFVIVLGAGPGSLWLAGQTSALLRGHGWPDTAPSAAPGVALRLTDHVSDPAQAWPAPARSAVGSPWLLYPLWIFAFLSTLAASGMPALRLALTRMRRRRFATHAGLHRALTADAVRARVDVIRPGLTIVDTDDELTRAAKAARRQDPIEVARFLGDDATSGQPLYLANEYTLLAAAVLRFGNKTTAIRSSR